jgi:hypothetical protein
MKIMRKIYQLLTLLIVAMLGFASCTNEVLVEPNGGGQGNTISFTLQGANGTSTRATAAPNPTNPTIVQTPALDREKAVQSIYAVLFHDGNWFKTIKANGSGTYTLPVDAAGTFDMYLVANPNAALVSKLENDVTNETSYLQLVADQTPGENNQATNFLMTSAKKTVTTNAGATTNAGVFKMVRVAARFDLYNRVDKLNITKITLKNRFVESRIERGAMNADMSGLAFNSTKTYGPAEGLKKYDCVAAMYSYENAFPGSTSLVIEGDYAGHPIKPTEILLEKLPVKRNHLYTIILTERNYNGDNNKFDPENVFGSLKFDVVVKDWEEGETVEWDELSHAQKVVSNFTAAATNLVEAGQENPATLTINNPAANVITLTVKGGPAGSQLVHTEGALPNGYSVNAGKVDIIEGVPTQTFKITLPQNKTYEKVLPFELQNALDPAIKTAFVLKHKGVRVKLPLEYMAEYNVAQDGFSFATSHDNDKAGGYFNFANAISKFAHIKIDNKAYHLPTPEEWLAVAGDYALWTEQNRVRFDRNNFVPNVAERVKVNGVVADYTADYKGTGDGRLAYAVKFKGNGDTYKCAYRYEVVGNPADGNKTSRIKVTARLLGTTNPADINAVANENFWNSNNQGDVVKYLSFAGTLEEDGTIVYGKRGYIHSTVVLDGTAGRTSQMKVAYFYTGLGNGNRDAQINVRLFSDK